MAALLDPAAPAIVAAIAESRQVRDLLRAAPLLSRLEAAADGSLRAPPHTESPARSHAERRAGSAARTAESDATRT